MKNETSLKFVKFMEYFAELLSIILIFDTKYSINHEKHFINSSGMLIITTTILVTFIFKIVCRIVLKKEKLKENEIDAIAPGTFVILLTWIGIILLLIICVNNEFIANLEINGAKIIDILG